MKKYFLLAALWLSMTQVLAQGFMDDIDLLSRDLELAKLCDALQKMGGDNPRCKSSKVLPAGGSGAPANARGGRSAAAQPAPNLDIAPEVLSYSRLGNVAELEVAHLNDVRTLRVGESIGPWRLQALTDQRATFSKGGLTRSLDFRSRPATPALGAGMLGTTGLPAPLRGLGPVN